MIHIKEETCDFCGSCVAICPEDCIEMGESFLYIDQEICTNCLLCLKVCPFGALEQVTEMESIDEKKI